MKNQYSKYYILLLLTVMFAAPGIAAYVFYQHPSWLGTSRINKGTLLNHPIELSSLAKTAKWRIVYWSQGRCNKQCLAQLDVLARVRLALGRKLYQVDQYLLVDRQSPEPGSSIKEILQSRDFKIAQLSSAEQGQMALLPPGVRVFIASPDNYLILGYSEQVNPDDVYKDLKLLLNTTETKNG